VVVAVLAGVVGLAVFVALVILVLAPRLGAVLAPDAAATPAPRWAPAGPAPVTAASTSPLEPVGTAGIAALVDPTWAATTASATGIPERAVLAYAGAALSKAASAPACRLSWTTLAAIGKAESDHGRHGGSSIGADGTVTPPIYGVALDGNGVALVPDSDGGTIDGDAAADRAVGPMQLIPQTWRNWHTDANGDGVEDPQNIEDAVMATTNYLCRASTALDTEGGWRAAISAYNSAPSYVAKVARLNAAVVGSLAQAPATPIGTAFKRDDASGGQAWTLTWAAAPGAASYEVLVRKTYSQQWESIVPAGTGTSFRLPVQLDDVVAGVRAVGPNGARSMVASIPGTTATR